MLILTAWILGPDKLVLLLTQTLTLLLLTDYDEVKQPEGGQRGRRGAAVRRADARAKQRE